LATETGFGFSGEGKDRYIDTLTESLELGNRGRPAASRKLRPRLFLVLFFSADDGQVLAAVVVFPDPWSPQSKSLKANLFNWRGASSAPHERNQFIMNDFDELVTRGDSFDHGIADGFFL